MVPDYLEHLTRSDLRFLADAGGIDGGPAVLARHLRSGPGAVDRVLADPAVFDGLFGPRAEDPLLVASPFLVFAVIVRRAAADLQHATFVNERTRPNQRVPVFDVAQLRTFLDDPLRRLFLVELLASYTTVASGVVWIRSSRGWRRQRFSELDPVRFAALLDVVPETERPGVYRRLGDLALFLTGVFPDASLSATLGPVALQRLARTAPGWQDGGSSPDALGALGLLEQLGARWYRLACTATSRQTAAMRIVEAVADRFHAARRVLNVVTDDYLFPYRSSWFPGASG